ncbi:MAG: hypothetical protein HFJ30_00775 [Clostridia bacterium]|jgi:hypothetical protein|nr:hypothetical protein [Clostridia bacterium]
MKKILIVFVILILIASGVSIIHYFTSRDSSSEILETLEVGKNNNIKNKADYQIVSHNDYIATKPEDLYEIADLVIVGKYIKDIECYVDEYASIITEAQFEISEILKGDYQSKSININYYGGVVPLKDYISKQTEEQLIKKGISNLSTQQLESKTIEYVVEDSQVEVDDIKESVIFLSYDKEKDYYFVLCNGYGMREVSDDNKMYNLDTKTFDTNVTELK